ncbi:plasmid partitioning protein RepB [Agrobacterium vitis]|uniref:Plasmid partitioning protein RepB n=1 Tax=Agrobacterium vitis TaxID=373 RepID=A0A368NYD8_AGRVI|nr:plasmid partitioning protein RepB [Agrobacterium vitis]KAA3510706.1 plasmid partitioning protein RepB [Agrobacterium vitis]KAA3527966.1 plasmid partitioning protein RepB [Agrobacterium vitis]MCF1478513.1 plasmid partitioning protein RepB [Agrobacterium vitis]MUZ75362.1 plasmid partitioning protein RepB [Agrobacterium vitis]MUZ96674.1 plasmid partitioning protein RepB [Agrobacterium vitis]
MIGKNRKSELRALFSDPGSGARPDTAEPSVPQPTVPGEPRSADTVEEQPPAAPVARAASGAIKAMGLTLSSITREAEEARALRQAIDEGERVISLATDKIDASFVSDRLSDEERDDPDFVALVASIRESGQQVPILVRRHPVDADRYQVAYGHRRLSAAKRLGIAVKALIRPLSDDELVLAQGKENAERRNLTFIERALFAKALADRGFDRKVIGEALSVQKSELSRLIQVAESVPERFARAVGPAPKAGRERWMALGQLLSSEQGQGKAAGLVSTDGFRIAATDERFQKLFDTLSGKAPVERPEPEDVRGPDGRVFARIGRQGRRLKIEFLAEANPGFVDQFETRLAAAYAAYLDGEHD